MKQRHISWWHRLLSFFQEVSLANASTDVSEDMVLSLRAGRLCLASKNAIYSYEDLYTSFRTALQHLEKEVKAAESALILGFGMGSIAWMIRNMLEADLPITGVELDPWIIRQFHYYYDFEDIYLIQSDAITYLGEADQTFDLVFVDIFEDEMIPPSYQEIAFFEKVKNVMNPGASIAYNKLPAEGENFGPETSLGRAFSQVFPANHMVPARANRILIGRKEA